MTRKILFFINPISGTKGKSLLKQKIAEKCAIHECSFEIMPTSKDGDYQFLKQKVTKDNITDVVICGGDGSLSPIISQLLHSNTNVGIIPTGSGNGLTRTVGIPSSVHKALDIILNGLPTPVDAFWVNGQLSCHLIGLGFDAKVALDFSKQRNRGVNTYIKEVIKNFLTIQKYSFEIELADGLHFKEAFMINVANSNQFGNNFKIAPQANISDGKLDVTILEKTNKPVILFELIKHVLTGTVSKIEEKDWHQSRIMYFQTDEIKIKNLSNAPFHLDGDPMPTSEDFTIKVIPKAYKLMLPK
jgi:YegS/Rv2252/BmrU family lipid kinase